MHAIDVATFISCSFTLARAVYNALSDATFETGYKCFITFFCIAKLRHEFDETESLFLIRGATQQTKR